MIKNVNVDNEEIDVKLLEMGNQIDVLNDYCNKNDNHEIIDVELKILEHIWSYAPSEKVLVESYSFERSKQLNYCIIIAIIKYKGLKIVEEKVFPNGISL